MKIPILHLEEGIHHFDEVIRGGSLHFYRSEVYPNDINVEVRLDKFEKNISCEVTIDTEAHYTCDRCLTEFTKKIQQNFRILFHIGVRDFDTKEEDVVLLLPEQVEVDLNPYIEENLILSIPMKMLCREDCKGICPGCGADLNHEVCRCGRSEIDPRWKKLKDLLD